MSSAVASPRGLSGPDVKRKLYREPSTEVLKLSLMSDPRVYRGKTSGILVRKDALASSVVKGPEEGKIPVTARRSAQVPHFQTISDLHRTVQPQPKPRQQVPLHLYLEEQSKPVSTTNEGAQTDAFVDLPPPQPYIPAKTGLDVSTQVQTELVFQFDADCDALIQVVVDKTLEQSLREVRQETELSNVENHRVQMLTQLRAEESEKQRLLKVERDRIEWQVAELEAAQKRAINLRRAAKIGTANHLAKQYLSGLTTSIVGHLDRQGFFFDPLQLEVAEFVSHMPASVEQELTLTQLARTLLDSITSSSVSNLVSAFAISDKQREIEQELLRKQRMIVQLYIHCDLFDGQVAGPLQLYGQSTISDVQTQVVAWMKKNLKSPLKYSGLTFTVGDSEVLEQTAVLHEIGVDKLSSLQLHIERDVDEDAAPSSPQPPADPEDEE